MSHLFHETSFVGGVGHLRHVIIQFGDSFRRVELNGGQLRCFTVCKTNARDYDVFVRIFFSLNLENTTTRFASAYYPILRQTGAPENRTITDESVHEYERKLGKRNTLARSEKGVEH
jgi:hypothetical protein